MSNDFAVWTAIACAMTGFVALPLGLDAAGSGHLGWAIVAAAVLLASIGTGVGFIGAVARYDHRHHHRTPHLF